MIKSPLKPFILPLLLFSAVVLGAGILFLFFPQLIAAQQADNKCGDWICDEFEQADPNLCPKDCRGPQECVQEGKDLGPVYPGITRQCCEGLTPYISPGKVGTRGICVKSSIVSTPKAKRPITRDSHFGINDAFLGGFEITSLSEGEKFLEERCRILNDLGAGWARGPSPFGVIWELVEPQKGTFDFSKADLGFKIPRKYGIQWVRGIWPYPKWEQDNSGDERQKKLYSNESDLIEYVRKVADRYPANYWEIGNEQMLLPFFKDPEVYNKFLKASYKGIKSVDPKATVLIGGMVGAESDYERISAPYLKRILDDDGGRYFDIMNFHDYDYSSNAIEKQAKRIIDLLTFLWVAKNHKFES